MTHPINKVDGPCRLRVADEVGMTFVENLGGLYQKLEKYKLRQDNLPRKTVSRCLVHDTHLQHPGLRCRPAPRCLL